MKESVKWVSKVIELSGEQVYKWSSELSGHM